MKKKYTRSANYCPIQPEFLTDLFEVQLSKISSKINMLVLLTDDRLGDKTSKISGSLMQQLIKGLAAKEPLPNAIVFLNRAVFLTAQNSPLLGVLRDLESKGVLILSNLSCLEHYQLIEKLAVGGLTNIYHTAELIKLAKNTITL